MNTQIFKKVLEGHELLTASDLSPQEKEILYNEMIKNGSTRDFAYNRFFKEGFSEWELKGILTIKREFLENNYFEIFVSIEGVHDIEIKSCHDYVYNPGEFYRLIGTVRGMKDKFKVLMKELGMSETTVIKRFGREDNKWKQYEFIGVRAVINELTNNNRFSRKSYDMSEWEWWPYPKMVKMLGYLITNVTCRRERLPSGNVISRGEIETTCSKLMKILDMTTKEVRIALDRMKCTGDIHTRVAHNHTIITLLNLGKYQDIRSYFYNKQ